jgi:hypothetical protein
LCIGIGVAAARHSLWLGIPLLALAALPAKFFKTRLKTLARVSARRDAAKN